MKKVLIVALAAGAMIGLAGMMTASAAPLRPSPTEPFLAGSGRHANEGKGDKTPPSLVAVAIGSVRAADGDRSIVDFRAALRDGDAHGNLRIFSTDMGYYNGGVKTLSVEGGVIKASGAGPLLRPDGTRTAVRYQAEINEATKRVVIKIEGRDGASYSLDGVLDPGFVKAGPPPAKDKAAKPKKAAKPAA